MISEFFQYASRAFSSAYYLLLEKLLDCLKKRVFDMQKRAAS
jgi:hypothetical protein